jgi:hypothetical protein
MLLQRSMEIKVKTRKKSYFLKNPFKDLGLANSI